MPHAQGKNSRSLSNWSHFRQSARLVSCNTSSASLAAGKSVLINHQICLWWRDSSTTNSSWFLSVMLDASLSFGTRRMVDLWQRFRPYQGKWPSGSLCINCAQGGQIINNYQIMWKMPQIQAFGNRLRQIRDWIYCKIWHFLLPSLETIHALGTFLFTRFRRR